MSISCYDGLCADLGRYQELFDTKMMSMPFIRNFAVISLFCAICVPSFAEVQTAEYRRPNENDLKWLLSDEDVPKPSEIVQVSFVHQKKYANNNKTNDAASGLTPHCKPCEPIVPPQTRQKTEPVQVPTPTKPKSKNIIPPAPTLGAGKNPNITGVSQDDIEKENAVKQIGTEIDVVETPIIEMSGKVIAPPLPPKELPQPDSEQRVTDNETNTSRPLTDNLFSLPYDAASNTADSQFTKRNSSVPDMVGSVTPLPQQTVNDNARSLTFLPTMLLSRPNITEHFNAAVQSRVWTDYRHWNTDFATHDTAEANRGSDHFSFGLEKKMTDIASLELRVPLLCGLASVPTDDNIGDTVAELGNISVFAKTTIRKKKYWELAGGIGVSFPTAKGYWAADGDRLSNKAYSLVPFIGLQWYPNEATFGHFVVQADVPLDKNELNGNSIDSPQVLRTGVQLGHWILQDERCRLGAFGEVNYAVVTDGTSGYLTVNPVRASQHTLTGNVGVSAVFNKLTITNAVILPLEHTGQSFSVGYNLSVNRGF